MTFSEALEKAKAGHLVWRTGWPIYLEKTASGQRAARDAGPVFLCDRARTLEGDTVVFYAPFLAQPNGKGDPTPWVPSQADMLADDWEVVTDDDS
jgi:hypothetical protein